MAPILTVVIKTRLLEIKKVVAYKEILYRNLPRRGLDPSPGKPVYNLNYAGVLMRYI